MHFTTIFKKRKKENPSSGKISDQELRAGEWFFSAHLLAHAHQERLGAVHSHRVHGRRRGGQAQELVTGRVASLATQGQDGMAPWALRLCAIIGHETHLGDRSVDGWAGARTGFPYIFPHIQGMEAR